MQCPRSSHLDAGTRILRYAKSSLDYGLMYRRHEKFMLNGFTKVDWVGDTTERHSTSRYCFITGLVMISWYSKKQPVVNYLALKLST